MYLMAESRFGRCLLNKIEMDELLLDPVFYSEKIELLNKKKLIIRKLSIRDLRIIYRFTGSRKNR